LGLAGLTGFVPGSGTGLLVPRPAMADDSPAKPTLVPLNRFSRMVHEDFVEQVRAAQAKGIAAKAALKTKADAEAYVKLVQQKIRRCFGPEPERTPLNPRVTGVVERDAYRIEKVIFESRPGFLVTANLYVPKGRKLPMPGVVGSCGHSVNGKAAEAYQSFAQGLARQGYVVLIFDPIGQGERLQYVDRELKPRRGVGVSEHLHAGNQQFLVGEFLGAWRVWDGVRSLDYLLSREEVDPKHVGITGNSGGGTMTTWLCGVERRWTMAAPACFVTSFRRNMENELPADTEQCPPLALAEGLDHEDFLAAMAPKPVIILAKERDYFDVRGSIEAHARLKRLYTLLDAPDNIQLHIGPTEHGYSQENREAMYRWFNRATGISDAAAEPQLTIEMDEKLLCTPRGQVADLNSRTVFEFTRATSRELSAARKKLSPAQLRDTLDDVLRLPARPVGPPEFRILRSTRPRGYPLPQATNYAVATERGIFALVTRLGAQRLDSRPPQGPERAVLYVSHHSADAELRDEPFVRKLIESEPNAAFFACDVRGIGESCPDTCGGPDQFTKPYGND
jgi:dienelactone hydrolase